MEVWLAQLPANVKVKLIYGATASDWNFCFHLVENSSVRNGLFFKNRAYLNSTGNANLDSLTIEYNRVLSGDDAEQMQRLFARSEFRHIEEFHFPGMQGNGIESWFDDSFVVTHKNSKCSYFVDLDDLRSAGSSYLDRLSANRRSQIRKSIRDVEKLGALELREAQDAGEALEMLGHLILYHQREWESRGEPGAFASDFFCAFHKDLIEQRFDAGEIQMLAVKAGDVSVGFLYNFVYERNVLFYQSGFNYGATRNCRPGLISHYLAVLHNQERGHGKYNFLAGGGHYKKSLSTGFDTLCWSIVSRRNLKSRLELLLRSIKRKFRKPDSETQE